MHVIRMTDPQTWDRALLALPNPHVLQSWAWGAFKSRHGWRADRFLFQKDGGTVAAASVLRRKLPVLPVSVLYVPKGPVFDWTDPVLTARVLAGLEDLARDWGALFVKIDPDVYHPGDAPTFSPRPTSVSMLTHVLKARGWRFSEDQIQFRNTMLLDLRQSEEKLLAAMKQKTRYNVRLAKRRGATVHEGVSAEALDSFYKLYAVTAERQGFAIRPADYYLDAWASFLEAEKAHLLLADVKGETVAGLVLFTFGPTAWYMYGASSNRHRKHMPNYLLQWEAIRKARAVGCNLYDLWGAPDHLDESDPMWGVYRFKRGFGSQLARGLGAWDFPASRMGYWFYTVVIPRYLAWLRGRHQVGQL
ncbi:MAG: peptidoglycan bridge formation glycyltransferase FemA/FemB family protein [Anaerolineae bacterium]|jgi:lipid II:glycine glycyltransferase (peptidoglycan interpeptide bridge formation enzyme)